MMKLWRSIILVSMLALFSGSILLHAQESTEEAEATDAVEATTITISGSGIVNPVVEAILASSEAALTTTTNGSAAGLADLCSGASPIVTASRAINVDEALRCTENAVDYYELIIGFDIPAIVANPQDSALACLTVDQLNTVFAPSAASQITNWNQVGLEQSPDLALTAIVPQDTTSTYSVLESFVDGVGLRTDAAPLAPAEAIAAVAATSGAVAVVPYQLAVESQGSVQIVSINFGSEIGCVSPSAETVEDGGYQLATPLLVYVNSASADALQTVLEALTADENANTIAAAGYTPASAVQFEINRAIVRGERENQSTTTEIAYVIPPDLSGTIAVGGSLAGYRIADAISNRLTSTYQAFTPAIQFSGQQADLAKLCGGTLDLLFTSAELSAEQLQACTDAGINTSTFALGSQAVVLVSNAADEFAACLTTEHIRTIWSNSSAGTVTSWNLVADTFSEAPLTLFSLREGNYLSDLLMARVGAPADTVRSDVAEQNFDPLYRAAATANVAGALTYMSWTDYERVLSNNQQNIQLVAVDAGSGCVVPSVETIAGGTYALAQQISLVARTSSLATKGAQSYVWSVFAAENQNLLTASGLVLPERTNDLRATLLVQFAEAEAQALAASAEATPEATEQTP
jgi:ABC-type phosphate transport system substrate-binding protein